MRLSTSSALYISKYAVETRYSRVLKLTTAFGVLVLLATMSQRPTLAQNTERQIYLSEASTIGIKEMGKHFQKECPNTSFAAEKEKGDYILEAKVITTTIPSNMQNVPPDVQTTNDLVLFDRDHILVRASSASNLGNAVKDVCHAIKNSILLEVVDSQTMTESLDVRGVSGGTGVAGAIGTIVNETTGRRTHTDSSLLYVISNGERAILDCYERRKGCTPTGNGKYYAEFDGESLWLDFRMPLIHTYVRNHYLVAGGW